ncbi:hypothetical protein TURU_088969 [Turdus rufiventris]|nr:hypothetical protein TURU_088969 [Turdus rufiventris]
MLEQAAAEGPYTMERSKLEQFTKNCSLWEGHAWEKFMEYSGAGEECSWSEDNIYTNVWSSLNHKIERIPCQQVPSVKFMFIGP